MWGMTVISKIQYLPWVYCISSLRKSTRWKKTFRVFYQHVCGHFLWKISQISACSACLILPLYSKKILYTCTENKRQQTEGEWNTRMWRSIRIFQNRAKHFWLFRSYQPAINEALGNHTAQTSSYLSQMSRKIKVLGSLTDEAHLPLNFTSQSELILA
jgi:hypothetical protein